MTPTHNLDTRGWTSSPGPWLPRAWQPAAAHWNGRLGHITPPSTLVTAIAWHELATIERNRRR